MRAFEFLTEKWSDKYKRSINCSSPKGFSQRAHCQGRKKKESLGEGGWDTTLTQGTVLKPKAVKLALDAVDRFVVDFNEFLKDKGVGPVRRGKPTGSSAYYEKDQEEDPDKVYGDIDLQMIAPAIEGKTQNQMSVLMNKLADDFVKSGAVPYFDTSESKPGHPIVKIGDSDYVQVDFMWHEEGTAKWGAARVTPERGVKGLLFGNMFSVLGELLDISIQHSGVQLKTVDGKKVPFSKQKDVKLVTISIEPETFVLDLFKYLAQQQGIEDPKIDPMLTRFPGNKVDDVKISNLVNAVKGFAKSADANDMFGKGDLNNYADANNFISAFKDRYTEKALRDINAAKRDKAETPEAKARAEEDRKKVAQGLDMVMGLF